MRRGWLERQQCARGSRVTSSAGGSKDGLVLVGTDLGKGDREEAG